MKRTRSSLLIIDWYWGHTQNKVVCLLLDTWHFPSPNLAFELAHSPDDCIDLRPWEITGIILFTTRIYGIWTNAFCDVAMIHGPNEEKICFWFPKRNHDWTETAYAETGIWSQKTTKKTNQSTRIMIPIQTVHDFFSWNPSKNTHKK